MAAPAAVGGLYRRMKLAAILAEPSARSGGLPWVRVLGRLPPTTLALPALAFGDTAAALAPARMRPARIGAAAIALTANPPRFYLLRNAVIHGARGVVTLGDRVVAETLAHVPPLEAPSAGLTDDAWLRLPERPLTAAIPAGVHLLLGNGTNYFHWLVDGLARSQADALAVFERALPSALPAVLLTPETETAWKRETLALVLPASRLRQTVGAADRILVEQLLYVSDLSGGGFCPHPRLLDVFAAIAAAAGSGADAGASPGRIYVSRADSSNRVLANEADVIRRVARHGFTPVVLSGMSVLAQARLFGQATHIIAPHGAGLTNLGFCRPGAMLGELHSPAYVNWAFRALAARRGVGYGCLIGRGTGQDRWELDPAALDCVLRHEEFSK